MSDIDRTRRDRACEFVNNPENAEGLGSCDRLWLANILGRMLREEARTASAKAEAVVDAPVVLFRRGRGRDLNLDAIEACASRDREGASPEDTIALVARVRKLEAALQRERERAEKAEAACAAMREALSRVASAEAALASDAGQVLPDRLISRSRSRRSSP